MRKTHRRFQQGKVSDPRTVFAAHAADRGFFGFAVLNSGSVFVLLHSFERNICVMIQNNKKTIAFVEFYAILVEEETCGALHSRKNSHAKLLRDRMRADD